MNIIELVFTAGFEQIYSLVFIVSALVFMLSKGALGILQWLLIIFGVITVLFAAYTYAILFLVIAGCASLVIPRTSKLNGGQFAFLAVILIVVLLLSAPNILDVLAMVFANNSGIEARITSLKNLLLGIEVTGSDALNRLFVYQVSIDTWLDNFWFGIGYSGFAQYGEQGIGGHSEIFDTLAYYGLIGGVFFLFSLFSTSYIVLKHFAGSDRLLMTMLFVIYVLMLIVNPCHTVGLYSTCYAIVPLIVFSAAMQKSESKSVRGSANVS